MRSWSPLLLLSGQLRTKKKKREEEKKKKRRRGKKVFSFVFYMLVRGSILGARFCFKTLKTVNYLRRKQQSNWFCCVNSLCNSNSSTNSIKIETSNTIYRDMGTENGVTTQDLKLLQGKEDRYGGMIIDSEMLPTNPAEFKIRLQSSIEHWKLHKVRGIWLKVPINLSELIPIAVKQGFEFHHAEKEYVMMTLWLPEDEPDRLPLSSTHQVGIGAFVLNENNEVLVVQERSGPLKGTGIWKIPTGVANRHEDIHLAAIREVKEETGIDANFECVISIRQAHGVAMGKSDLFFVCGMRVNSEGLQLKPEEHEIVAVKWMPLEEYAQMDFLRKRPLMAKILQQCVAFAHGRFQGFKGGRVGGGGAFTPREDFLLWGIDDHANL
eukprot:TRINITY_DN5459_c0_g1_i1.p1 TRINITY_DN5459_c0_g1~~TRINITY_DN5459_c0_g1_i1.p1  ORF type:complete len:381 (-),score=34.15 TRINITY_DN5459_c0_g1_i1:605-1747(-)